MARAPAERANQRPVNAEVKQRVVESEVIDVDGESSSPIEDPSAFLSAPQPQPQPQRHPSLHLEVQKRVAQHASMKGRGKVLKKSATTSKPPNNVIPIDLSSIIYVDSSSSSSRASSPVPVLPSKSSKDKGKGKAVQPVKPPPKKKSSKDKKLHFTPTEYAHMLLDKLALGEIQNSRLKQFLQGLNILYLGGDMKYASESTRKKMDLVSRVRSSLAQY